MPDPNKIAIQPQDTIPFVRNGDTGREDEWWRAQRVDPVARRGITTHFQLGSVDPVGVTQDAPEYTVTVEHFMHDMVAELILAGKNPGVDTSYNLGDLFTQDAIRVNLMERNENGVPTREYEFDTGAVATFAWAFAVRAPSTVTTEIRAALAKLYCTGGSIPHSGGSTAYPTDDTSSPGAILGKDARIRVGTDVVGSRQYRLQSFNIRSAFPIDVVRELGRRSIVGNLARQPTTTVDFELLTADCQPHTFWFDQVAGANPYYDFAESNEGDVFIRLYDPDLAEANTVIRAWKLENARPGDVTPMSVTVGGLAATRYTLQLGKPDTSGSGGVICYKGDIP